MVITLCTIENWLWSPSNHTWRWRNWDT